MQIQERYACSPAEMGKMNTAQLRNEFLIQDLFLQDKSTFFYSHYDRMMIGGVLPINDSISLSTLEPLKADYFLERREIGIINIGGAGSVSADGDNYDLNKLDCLYVGKGTKDVCF